MSGNKYLLLNCENARKLIRYTSSINNYLFYDDYLIFKKNKDKIKKDFIKSLVDLIIKETAKNAMGKQAGKMLGNLLNKRGGKFPKLPKIKIPKLPKSLKSAKLPKSPKLPKSSKSPKLPKSASIISKPCEFIAKMQSDNMDSSLITKKIKDVGIHIQNFGKKQKLESFKFIGDIMVDEKFMDTNGKEIIIKSMCNDPFLTFEACVLRKPTAIAQLSITGIEKTLEQIDKIIAEKYPKVIQMFKTKNITFKENKIKAKYILNDTIKDVSIVKFNLTDKNISIKLGKETIKITKDNVAFIKNNEEYKKINIENIEKYLITDIDNNNLDSKCPKI
jgi:hypothetical protein